MNAAPPTMWLWIIGVAGLVVGLPVLIVGATVLISTRRSRRGPREAAARQARIGRIGGLLVGALAGAFAFLAGFGMLAPDLVAVGYLFGVLVTELRRSSQPSGPIRAASLQVRDAWRYLPRWVVPVTVAAAVLSAIAPVVFAVEPRPSYASTSWMVVVATPLALIAVLALVGWVVLMARVTNLPQPVVQGPDGRKVTPDLTNTARAISGAVLGVELLVLGALTIVASSDLVRPFVTSGAAYLGSRILVWLGLGLALTGLLTWSIMSRWRTVPGEQAEPANPAGPGGPAGPAGPADPRDPPAPAPATPATAGPGVA